MRVSRDDEALRWAIRRLVGPLAPLTAMALTVVAVVGLVGTADAADVPGPVATTTSPAAPPPPKLTALPAGRPRYVVSMLGGSYNRYWVRLAEYTFTPGPNGVGAVHQSYWMWDQSHFSGNAKRNKVGTGFVTARCAASCVVRTPRGYQPGSGPMASLSGHYRFDRYGRLVVQWPGRRTEVWTVRTSGPRLAHLILYRTTLGGLSGDGLGSGAPFTVGVTRDQVAAAHLTGVQRVASYGDGGRYPVRTSRWTTNVVAPMRRCTGARSACLFTTGKAWRSAIVVPPGLGRRAFWQHQKQGSDGDHGACFGSGGGHTVALLQAVDDSGRFAGFVGAEASFNSRARHNAVVAQLVLT
jgi:hypothetical protein